MTAPQPRAHAAAALLLAAAAALAWSGTRAAPAWASAVGPATAARFTVARVRFGRPPARRPAPQLPTAAQLAQLGWSWEPGVPAAARGAVMLCRLAPTSRSSDGASDETDDGDPAGWYHAPADAQLPAAHVSRRMRRHLAQPPPAWDVPAGAAHPLAQGGTDWVRQQAALLRRLQAAAARAGVAREPPRDGGGGGGGVRRNGTVFDTPLSWDEEEAGGGGGGGGLLLHWPLPDLLPLPALVRVGRAQPSRGGGDRTQHDRLRAAMRRYTTARLGKQQQQQQQQPRAAARLLQRALASLPLSEALGLVDDAWWDGETGADGSGPPSVGIDALGVGYNGGGWVQPWLSPVLRFVVSRGTLEALALPELRMLARALSRTCGDVAAAQAASDWAGASLLAGGLVDAGCGAEADEAEVMRPPPRAARRAAAAAVPAHRAARMAAQTAAARGTSEAPDGAAPARIPAHKLWRNSSIEPAQGTAAAPPLRVAVLQTVRIDVRASDKRALRHAGARHAGPAGAHPMAAMSDAAIRGLLEVVRAAVPPSQLAAAAVAAAAAAASRNGSSNNSGVGAGDAPLAALLDDTQRRLRNLRLPLGARTGGVPGDDYAYGGQPLPWQGQDESFLLALDAADEEAAAVATAVEDGASAWLHSQGAPRAAAGGVASQPAAASLHAARVWGAIRGLQTLLQALQSWGLAGEGDDSVGPGGAHVRNDAPALLRALLVEAQAAGGGSGGGGAAAAAPSSSRSASIATLATQLAPACALRALQRHAQLTGSLPDPGRPLPIALPLTIADAPWRAWRGLSVDTSRHFLPLPTLFRTLDALAATRASVLHWHLSDAQSFPLALASLPAVARASAWGANHSFVYTRSDVAAVVRYAADRGLRVVPELDLPAHTRALGQAPETWDALVHCDGVAGGSLHDHDKYALDPTAPTTYARLAVMLAEVASLFPDGTLHIGADEVVAACWAAEGRLGTWAAAHLPALTASLAGHRDWQHTPTYLALLAHFMHTVHGLLGALGAQGVSWGDSHELLTAGERSISRPRRRRSLAAGAPAQAHRALWDAVEVGPAAGGAQPRALRAVHASLERALGLRRRATTASPQRREAQEPESGCIACSPTAAPVELQDNGGLADAPAPARGLQGSRNASRTPSAPAPVPAAAASPTPTATHAARSDGDAVDAAFAALVLGPALVGPAGADNASSSSSSSPAARLHPQPLLEYAYGQRTAIEAWKCWEAHGDDALLQAAEDDYGDGAWERAGDALLSGDDADEEAEQAAGGGALAPFPARPVINAACTYLDYSPTWTEYARKWPLPETSRAWARLVRLARARWPLWAGAAAAARNASIVSAGASQPPPPPLLPLTLSSLLFAPWPYAGGEASIWTERMDGTNVLARSWPRGAAALEVFSSQALAVDRVARALRAAGERAADMQLDGAAAPATLAWGGRVDDLVALQSYLRGAAVRLARFTSHQLWARGVGSSPLAIFDLAAAAAPVMVDDGGASGAAAAGAAASLPDLGCDGVLATHASAGWSGRLFKRFDTNEHTDTPAYNGVGPGIEQSVQRDPGAVPQPPPPLPPPPLVANGSGKAALAAASRCSTPACAVRLLVWNIDEGGGSGTPSRALGPAGARWDALAEYLREHAAQYDVVAVVEAVGWHAGRANPRRLDWAAQTLAFRRRAADLGYAHAHLLDAASGYSLALLSTAPVVPVLRERGALFERGLLAADSHGVRWLLAHLHAHDPVARAAEARWAAALARRYTAAGLRVVLAGDLNSLSPLDAACHVALGVPDWLGDAATAPFLRAKFSVPGSAPPQPDYRPLAALLAALPGGGAATPPLSGPLHDAVAPGGLHPAAPDAGGDDGDGGAWEPAGAAGSGGRVRGCGGTTPTSFATDDSGQRPPPPLRIDHVLVNEAVLRPQLGGGGVEAAASGGSGGGGVSRSTGAPPCHVVRSTAVAAMSDHYPVACEFFL